MKYFSKTTGGFYTSEIHENIPSDAIEITENEHKALLQAQSEGGIIVSDIDGKPIIKKPEPLSIDELKIRKLKDLAAYRHNIETKGIIFNGINIKTDRESQAQLNSVVYSLQSGLISNTPWKGENGWILVTIDTILPIAKAVSEYVKACFVNEEFHYNQIILLNTLEDIEKYDFTTSWNL